MKAAALLIEMLSVGEKMDGGGAAATATVRLRKQSLERWGTTDCKSIQEQNGRCGCDEVIAMTAAMVEKLIEHMS